MKYYLHWARAFLTLPTDRGYFSLPVDPRGGEFPKDGRFGSLPLPLHSKAFGMVRQEDK